MSDKVETKIYKYVDRNDTTYVEYWKIKTDPIKKTIVTESYRSNLKIYNVFQEELKDDGAYLTKYEDYNSNQKAIPSEITKNKVYKWTGTSSYSYSVTYEVENENIKDRMTKTRKQIGFENIEVSNKIYNTVKFLDLYKMEMLGLDLDYNMEQITFYAKDFGMVEYRRFIPNGNSIELELDKILTEKEFEELKAASR